MDRENQLQPVIQPGMTVSLYLLLCLLDLYVGKSVTAFVSCSASSVYYMEKQTEHCTKDKKNACKSRQIFLNIVYAINWQSFLGPPELVHMMQVSVLVLSNFLV